MAHKSLWRNVLTISALILFMLSLWYLAQRSILDHRRDVDFRFVWTAGKLWALGVDPYSPQFMAMGGAMFTSGNRIVYWLYPPQWWVIARPLAAFPMETALTIWRSLNAVLLLAASSGLAWAVRRARPETPGWAFIALVALVPLMEGSAQTLLLGQTSILVYAGFCLLGCALLTDRQSPMVAGLVLLSLKPQFAIPVLLYLALARKWRLSVVIALAVTGLAALPQFIQFGLLPTIRGMIGILSLHAQMNTPRDLIGFSHLVWQMTGISISNEGDILLDALACLIFGLAISRRHGPGERNAAALGVGLIAPAMFLLPLHAYDTVALAAAAMLAILLEAVPRGFAWAAMALALHPGLISARLSFLGIGDQLLMSLAGLLALIAAATAALSRSGSRAMATAPMPAPHAGGEHRL